MPISPFETTPLPRRRSRAKLAPLVGLLVLLLPACSSSCAGPPEPARPPAPVSSARRPAVGDPSTTPPQSLAMSEQAARRLGIDPGRHLTKGQPPGTPAAAAGSTTPAATAPPGEPGGTVGFLGEPEAELLERLRAGAVTGVSKGIGGRTLAFKVTLADGTKGYFKPEQRVSSASWQAEVAAHYLDRALGLGRVPPLVSRRLPWSLFEAAAGKDARVPEVTRAMDGSVRGALVAWLPKPLLPAATPAGWENWIRSAPFPKTAVTPYQRSVLYWEAINAAARRAKQGEPAVVRYAKVPQPKDPALPAALSDMIIFDFLTLNYDRFGGDNVNVLTLGPGGPLIWLDNGDAFSVGPPRRSGLDARLEPLSRFRRRTVAALRALDVPALGATLARDPLAPILTPSLLRGLEVRRLAVLEHVAAQERRFGEAVYAW